MPGTVLALLVAFFVAGRDALSKITLKEMDEYVVCWATALLTFLFLLPTLFFVPMPYIREGFLMSLFIGAVLNLLARLVFLKAIKGADLSLVAPLLSFSPAFLMLTAPLFSRETPTLYGVVGLGLMLIGSCILTIRKGDVGYRASIRNLLMQRWVRMGLVVAIIWGIAGLVDKAGIHDSSPLFWAVCVQGFMVVLAMPVVVRRTWARGRKIAPTLKPIIPIGFANAVVIGCYVMALSISPVSVVFTLYQTNIVISVLLGWLLFKERDINDRLKGASVMLAGAIVISAI
ncbi:MAG: EamA family transporter [Actinobacteria bacterium]|nr:EamA family transporter [Actinomycetota bacterium]